MYISNQSVHIYISNHEKANARRQMNSQVRKQVIEVVARGEAGGSEVRICGVEGRGVIGWVKNSTSTREFD